MNILSLLNQLAENPSKNFKVDFLKQHAENEELKFCFKLAYDPLTNFYIKKIPEYGIGEMNFSLLESLNYLSILSSRVKTGQDGIDFLSDMLCALSEDDAEVLKRIILRDLRVGCSRDTANKVWPNLIVDPPYQRCSLPAKVKLQNWDWESGVYSNLKADGSFCNVNHYEDSTVDFMTRTGNTYPEKYFCNIISALQKNGWSRGSQFHGELLVYENDKLLERAEGNGILNKLQKGGDLPEGHEVRFVTWDIIPIAEAKPKNKYKVPYHQRFNNLSWLDLSDKAISIIETRLVHSIQEAYVHYQEMLEKGLEGTIIKNPMAIWEDTTSREQCKLKLDVAVELKCIGFTEGKGKNADLFGAMLMESSDGLVTVKISGMSDEVRAEIDGHRVDYIGKIASVMSNAMTKVRKDGTISLFLPRFIEWRMDKNNADSLSQIKDQFENAVKNIGVLTK